MIIMDVNAPTSSNKLSLRTVAKKPNLVVFPSNQFCFKKYNTLNFAQEMLLTLQNLEFSPENLAKELNVTVNTIYRILNGQIKSPQRQMFYRLLRFYCAHYWSKEI